MRNVFVAVTLLIAVGLLAGSAQAQVNTCKTHKDQTSCAADKACKWATPDNECHKANPKKPSKPKTK